MKAGIILLVLTLLLSFTSSSDAQGNEDVYQFMKDFKMTWAYEEVRPGAFMFWWLYYTHGKDNYLNVPLVIWLQGGPGASSTGFGNFMEIGPVDQKLKLRENSWANYSNVLFIDSPVGSGYSYVNDTKLLVTNNTQAAQDLVQLLIGFFRKVPEFQTVPTYIFSESYGGKIATQFALRLSKLIQKKKLKCNLKGLNLGDGWISPIDSVLTWAPFLFSTSLIDNTGFSLVNATAYKVKAAVNAHDYKLATKLSKTTEDIVMKVTNGVSFYNILQTPSSSHTSNGNLCSNHANFRHLCHHYTDELSALMNGQIKKNLRIIPANVTWGGQSKLVFEALADDLMRPVTLMVDAILNNTAIAVNVYSGQLDLIVDTMGTTRWVERLRWAGIPNWKKSIRNPIIIGNSTVAFVKSFKNFSFYWILKSGHMVPIDTPETGVEILRLITGTKKLGD